jgi:glycosyltransferase involved in cell wall biosynthesis
MSILLTPDAPKAVVERPAPIVLQAMRPVRHRLAIAVVSYRLPCMGQARGGIEQVAHDLANALVDRGHMVTVFTYDPAPPTARYRTEPLPMRRFATSWLGRQTTAGFLGNVVALGPDYRKFDVIMAHGDSLLLPLTGKPIVRLMHGSAREEARRATSMAATALRYGVYIQELLTARMQRGTVAVSPGAQRASEHIQHMIPNGIDLTVFRPDPSERSPQPSILFVGALGRRNRGQWLVDQFRQRIRPAWPAAELHLVCAAGQGEAGVHYHTGVATADLVRLYQQAWVYASPSTYEAFGLTYLEAMASGTPVVATPNPGSRELLADGRYGVIADDEQFADAVLRLLGTHEARQEMTARGLMRARSYDIAGTAQAYEALMEELIAS